MPETTSTTRGFDVHCPHCGCQEQSIGIPHLADVETLLCSECDEEFDPYSARELVAAELARWDALIAWLESVPASSK